MPTSWTTDQLERLDAADDLHIVAYREDGTRLRPVPIWVVRVGDRVYVRSWHRRDTGWFGHAVRSHRAGISVPGVEAEVRVEDLADSSPEVTADMDSAYRTKYADGADSMVTPAAQTTTLRLDPL